MSFKISGLTFSILSPNLVKSLATVRIMSSDLYDADGYPIEGGVMDPRLGVVDPGLKCRTCGGGLDECMGHFGYMELARPVIHVLYTKNIHIILKVTCRKCSKVMTREKTDIKAITKTPPKTCPHCKAKQKKVEFEKTYTYYEDKKELNPMEIRERFEKIPDEDLKKIGFMGGRPEWLILTLLPIPPVTMRPSITLETGERSEDDLTHKMADIVRINQSLRENIDIGAPEFILNDLWELVQYHVSTYFDNELTGVPHARHRSGRPLRGLVQRLKAKEGRIRGNLLGKRVNFSARTVISPDPRISINDVGIPESVANELTVPEYVTPTNMKYIKDLIKTGKANYLNRPDGRRIKITDDNKKDLMDNISVGWSLDRQLRDNDIVLFNRQPSLHRMSIMGHRVRVMPHKTFRLSPAVCPPYNADFDGDEMNVHVPQTVEAKTETSMLMLVEKNIISPKFGGPVIGLDLDQVSGTYLLTQGSFAYTKEETSRMLSDAGIYADLPDKDKMTGKEIFSLLLPKELNLGFKSNSCENCDMCKKEKCEYNAWVSIKSGKVETGVIDSKAVGAFKGKILNKIRLIGGDSALRKFIDDAGRLGVSYLMRRGFSMGLSDLDIPKNIKGKIGAEIEKAKKDSDRLIGEFNKKTIKILPGMTMEESLEAQILNVLASGLNIVSRIVDDNIKTSDIVNMTKSGSKGSIVNTTQMAACVGQEAILGQRIKRGYYNRTLSHFKRGDLSSDAHGFVARGFKQGLTPAEIFWNIMNGREGLMDKSLRTRKSGYMQRRLVNALQDLRIEADNTVRSSNGKIVQFLVGEDGLSPAKSSWGQLDWGDWEE